MVDAVPQQLDRALVAILGEHAGAAELEELQLGVAADQRIDVEFVRRVEAAELLRQRLAQQAVGADHRRAGIERVAVALFAILGVIDDQQVVADRVVGVDVAARQQPRRVRDRRALSIENPVAQLLRLAHLLCGLRQPHFERADAAEALRRPVRARGPGLQAAIGLQRRD